MATINLGAIKFNWKGAYNSGTSYAVDDVVSSGGNSYVCIQAHSNQAVGNATAYWNIMSSAGTNGTNGTDVGTTLTTQGDILYRDGSGLQRLPKGTANQELRINSGATAPEWYTPTVASSDFVKLASGTLPTNVAEVDIDGFFSSTYKFYKVHITCSATNASGQTIRFRWRTSSAVMTANEYVRGGSYAGVSTGNSSTGVFGNLYNYNGDHIPLCHLGNGASDNTCLELTLIDPLNTSTFPQVHSRAFGKDGSGSWVNWDVKGIYRAGTVAMNGIRLFTGNDTNFTQVGSYSVYGIKA